MVVATAGHYKHVRWRRGASCPGTIGTNVAWDEAVDISDDGSLIWLTDPSLAQSVVANLSTPAE